MAAGIRETDAFECLRYDWGSAYEITRYPYRAVRRDDPAVVLEAETLDELRELVRADYSARPVPREIAP